MISYPPQDSKRWSVSSSSDVFGSIFYTKNINLDEEGYLKLAHRTVMLDTSRVDSNVGLPTSFGRTAVGEFVAVLSTDPFEIDIDATSLSALIDDNTPPGTDFNSYGTWWQNRWYVAYNSNLSYKTISSGAWTGSLLSLTSGVDHPVEVFASRNNLLVGDGNVIKQINTSEKGKC